MKKPTKIKTLAKAAGKPKGASRAKRTPKAAKTPASAQKPTADGPAKPKTRIEALTELLRIPGGVTSKQIEAEFGWLPHTTRAAISKIEGVTKVKDKARVGTVYSIPAQTAAA